MQFQLQAWVQVQLRPAAAAALSAASLVLSLLQEYGLQQGWAALLDQLQ